MPMTFEQNRLIPTTQNLEPFGKQKTKQNKTKKSSFFRPFFDKVLTPFGEDVSEAKTNVKC